MQELVGRLTALDPEASESLKVVGYFDALVTGQVSVEVLARSAALLAGCPVGVELRERVIRTSPHGDRLEPGSAEGWPAHDVGDRVTVWIEREGEPHANDAMLLERFAIAIAITLSRATSDSGAHRAAEVVVDATAPAPDRAAAAARLRLDAHARVRAIAVPVASPSDEQHPSAIVSTPFGLARVIIIPDGLQRTFRDNGDGDDSDGADGRIGIGLAVQAVGLPSSWSSALVALRLADEHSPVVNAEQLGALLLLAEASDGVAEPHPDVVALSRISDDRTALSTLDALRDEGSVRAAAAALGVHHSTVQGRLTGLVATLGYDPRTADGRTRYATARMLQRLRSARL